MSSSPDRRRRRHDTRPLRVLSAPRSRPSKFQRALRRLAQSLLIVGMLAGGLFAAQSLAGGTSKNWFTTSTNSSSTTAPATTAEMPTTAEESTTTDETTGTWPTTTSSTTTAPATTTSAAPTQTVVVTETITGPTTTVEMPTTTEKPVTTEKIITVPGPSIYTRTVVTRTRWRTRKVVRIVRICVKPKSTTKRTSTTTFPTLTTTTVPFTG